jgi:hypothetical protein
MTRKSPSDRQIRRQDKRLQWEVGGFHRGRIRDPAIDRRTCPADSWNTYLLPSPVAVDKQERATNNLISKHVMMYLDLLA